MLRASWRTPVARHLQHPLKPVIGHIYVAFGWKCYRFSSQRDNGAAAILAAVRQHAHRGRFLAVHALSPDGRRRGAVSMAWGGPAVEFLWTDQAIPKRSNMHQKPHEKTKLSRLKPHKKQKRACLTATCMGLITHRWVTRTGLVRRLCCSAGRAHGEALVGDGMCELADWRCHAGLGGGSTTSFCGWGRWMDGLRVVA